MLAVIIMPLLALIILEMALRLGGYGYPTGFFKPMRIGDQEMLVENDSFGFRFFPPDIARMPATLRIPAKKDPRTYRIFILGESAALGDPEPSFGAGRYLEVLLRDQFPNAKFEVVNVAMTAINSHAILPIARECARHDEPGHSKIAPGTIAGGGRPEVERKRFQSGVVERHEDVCWKPD